MRTLHSAQCRPPWWVQRPEQVQGADQSTRESFQTYFLSLSKVTPIPFKIQNFKMVPSHSVRLLYVLIVTSHLLSTVWCFEHTHHTFWPQLRNSASSFHWLSSSIFTCLLFVVAWPGSVTPSLVSTIWCFRPYNPYIFCEDMILATCQCHILSYIYLQSEFRIVVRCQVTLLFWANHVLWKRPFEKKM